MFKPFYVHWHFPPGKMPNRTPRGFTAFVSPHDDTHVKMQVAFCSPKDEFNKKKGRSYAEQAVVELVPKRRVPMMLSGCVRVCTPNELPLYGSGNVERDWYYIFKHML